MKFTTEYSKLSTVRFTTIRKNTGFYKPGKPINVVTPKQNFKVKIMKVTPLKKEDITDNLAQYDADCSKDELIKKLETWYGKKYNDFVLIEMEKT